MHAAAPTASRIDAQLRIAVYPTLAADPPAAFYLPQCGPPDAFRLAQTPPTWRLAAQGAGFALRAADGLKSSGCAWEVRLLASL